MTKIGLVVPLHGSGLTLPKEVKPLGKSERPVKVDRTFLAAVRQLAEDVILLDGDQDEAPSLAQMAREARAILERLGSA